MFSSTSAKAFNSQSSSLISSWRVPSDVIHRPTQYYLSSASGMQRCSCFSRLARCRDHPLVATLLCCSRNSLRRPFQLPRSPGSCRDPQGSEWAFASAALPPESPQASNSMYSIITSPGYERLSSGPGDPPGSDQPRDLSLALFQQQSPNHTSLADVASLFRLDKSLLGYRQTGQLASQIPAEKARSCQAPRLLQACRIEQ